MATTPLVPPLPDHPHATHHEAQPTHHTSHHPTSSRGAHTRQAKHHSLPAEALRLRNCAIARNAARGRAVRLAHQDLQNLFDLETRRGGEGGNVSALELRTFANLVDLAGGLLGSAPLARLTLVRVGAA